MFRDRGQYFGRLQTLIGENHSSWSVDPRPSSGRPHIPALTRLTHVHLVVDHTLPASTRLTHVHLVVDHTLPTSTCYGSHCNFIESVFDFILCQKTFCITALFHSFYSQPCNEMLGFSGRSHCCNCTFTDVDCRLGH